MTLISLTIDVESTFSPILNLVIYQDGFYKLNKQVSRDSIHSMINSDDYMDQIIDDMISDKVKLTKEEINNIYVDFFDDEKMDIGGYQELARGLLISLRRDDLIDGIIKSKE